MPPHGAPVLVLEAAQEAQVNPQRDSAFGPPLVELLAILRALRVSTEVWGCFEVHLVEEDVRALHLHDNNYERLGALC